MTLADELTEISGVGEATAEKIIEIVDSNSTDGVDTDDVERALYFFDRGSYDAGISVLEAALDE